MKKHWLIKFFPYFLIVCFAVIGVYSFFSAGYFPSHDGEWMVIRFSDFHRSLVDGQWPVRWAGRLNFGFGYPVFNFLYPGTFYLAEIFHLLKLNFVDSIKALFVTSYLLSGIFMYLLAKEWFGKTGGFISAIVYLFTPYRFVDMYVRGSLGESVAFIFAPLIFLAITKISNLTSKRFLWIGIGALSLMGLITTHNVIAYLFLPLIIIYVFFLHLGQKSKNNDFILLFLHLLLLGLGASAFFWLPALWDKQFTIFDQVIIADFKNNFPSFLDLIKPSWGYGPSEPGRNLSMSFQVGIVNWLTLVLGTLFAFLKKNPYRKKGIFFIATMLVGIFLMTKYSEPLWSLIPGLSLIQFPWRILSVTTFASAILAGFLITNFKHKLGLIIGGAIILAVIVLNYTYTFPSKHVERGEGYYTTNDDTTTVQSEYLPSWAKDLPRRRSEKKAEITKGNGIVTNFLSKSNATHFAYEGENGVIKINTAFFPGWEAFINGKKQEIVIDNKGLIILPVLSGKNNVSLVFKETPIRKLSDLLSLVSVMGIVGLILTTWAKRKPLL